MVEDDYKLLINNYLFYTNDKLISNQRYWIIGMFVFEIN